jgi:hypothetical protein
MKTLKIALTVLFLFFVLFQSIVIMASNKNEEQKYTVIQKEKNVEIRFYPAATFATIESKANNYRDLSSPGFRKLAGYIFGNNESSTHISMTSPVHMDVNDTLSTMSFVMPLAYNKTNLPNPTDASVKIKEVPNEYAAIIRFGGYANDEKLKLYAEKLRNILTEKGIKTIGHFRFLGYNPPFQFIARRNEIIVSIEWNK